MSIKITDLVKRFGNQTAVDHISFAAEPGKIMGFLGPNGAGKSTTMRIIAGYLPASYGTVEVAGFDVQTQAKQVHANLGYLPENNPLYEHMYVKEYLAFRAGLHKIKQAKSRISMMIEQTGLAPEVHKRISQLSKGYRQRVGLAQALLHNPPILVLDEPTSGLDPNQLSGIRKLIKELGKEKTVLLSTHIMQEVEALCDQVLIINKGKIVANEVIADLTQRSNAESVFLVEFGEAVTENELRALEGVRSVEKNGKKSYLVRAANQQDIRQSLFRWAVGKNIDLLNMQKIENRLEDIFRDLTDPK